MSTLTVPIRIGQLESVQPLDQQYVVVKRAT